MRKSDIPPDPQKGEDPDPVLPLSEELAPIDVKSFGRKLAEIIEGVESRARSAGEIDSTPS
jgi:hypothetical protein